MSDNAEKYKYEFSEDFAIFPYVKNISISDFYQGLILFQEQDNGAITLKNYKALKNACLNALKKNNFEDAVGYGVLLREHYGSAGDTYLMLVYANWALRENNKDYAAQAREAFRSLSKYVGSDSYDALKKYDPILNVNTVDLFQSLRSAKLLVAASTGVDTVVDSEVGLVHKNKP